MFSARKVEYISNNIDIPPSFLTGPPATKITLKLIDFAASPLPQFAPYTAFIIDDVLSKEECKDLLQLAEASVPVREKGSPWQPAMVSLGPGVEAPAPGYRESDRIIWDQQTVVNRIWERCSYASGVRELLATAPHKYLQNGGRWEFRRFNERMRFLKYSPGQYFKPHTDAPYWYEKGGTQFQTHYTVQLYLNDSIDVDPHADLAGGATAFLSTDRNGRLDVHPKAGTVLLFQHHGLFHEGAEVKNGVKFAMRTDIIYQWVTDATSDPKGPEYTVRN